MDDLKALIREVPDFPKPGILFYDITTLLKDKTGFRTVIDRLTEQVSTTKPDLVVGIEARGFIFGPALAYHLGAGFAPIRKPKKLPSATESISYELEYGLRYPRGPQGRGIEGNPGFDRRRSARDRRHRSGGWTPY